MVQICFISTLPGEMKTIYSYFSNGLKSPTSNDGRCSISSPTPKNQKPRTGGLWAPFHCWKVMQVQILSKKVTVSGGYLTRLHEEYLKQLTTRWWFHIFFICIPMWGDDPIWRAYFSNVLKPPARLYKTSIWTNFSRNLTVMSFLSSQKMHWFCENLPILPRSSG